ncbi:MAG TPA: hypothetical protein H9795_04075 [Candidatus Fournierella merdigallinarum]|nr:hypothetical protein [Candidatus Fournierella merdigallinarum]
MGGRYDDILHLPRPEWPGPRLSAWQRAAQFSPFAALSGYEAVLEEAARLTDGAVELGEDAAAALDAKQRILTARLAERPEITVTWFEPDEKKAGGAVRTARGRLRRLDEAAGALVLEDGRRIPLKGVLALDSELFPPGL